MIVYRKATPLRIKRAAVPSPPFWFATAIAPYSARRAAPVAIDYLDLRASSSEKLEVTVCDSPRAELERAPRLPEPLLIEATEIAEQIFGRGAEALAYCEENGAAVLHLVSPLGDLPRRADTPVRQPGDTPVPRLRRIAGGEDSPEGLSDTTIAIAAWPPDLAELGQMCAAAASAGFLFGVVVPIVFPLTTDLPLLSSIAEIVQRHAGSFLASFPVAADPTARQAIARMLELDDSDDTYAMLFHSDLEPIELATERHVAALASEIGVADFVVPPRWRQKTNWNASVLLTLTAARMLAMGDDIELARTLARSARAVAALDKPLIRIAEAASLSIVEALDEVAVDILTDWLESGRSSFVEKVNREWRLRRDAGMM